MIINRFQIHWPTAIGCAIIVMIPPLVLALLFAILELFIRTGK